MGLSNFPCLAEGALPGLIMNSVFSMALLKNLLRSALQVIGASSEGSEVEEEEDPFGFGCSEVNNGARERRVSITQFKSLCHGVPTSNNNGGSGSGGVECSVCLCRFGEDEEVSELSCNHFFHKSCLDKWFHINHTTCPLCRSID